MCAQRAAVDSSDALAADARMAARAADPLKNPRRLADPEVQQLSGWHDALTLRLRATEDRLLVLVKKSADYDVAASEKVSALQDERLLLLVALQQLAQRRLRRAQDVVDGINTAMPRWWPPALAKAAVNRTRSRSCCSEHRRRWMPGKCRVTPSAER